MNGIKVKNNRQANNTGGNGQSRIKAGNVRIEYTDGDTFTFVPEPGDEFLGQDEMLMIADRLLKASEVMEWGAANSRPSM